MRALAIGTAAGLALAVALTPAALDSRDRLAAARADHARVTALAAEPQRAAIVLSGVAIAARGGAAASAALAARVRALANRRGVLVEEAAANPGGGLARVRLRVSGSEDAVIAFADSLERERPLARFARWQLVAEGTSVRLTGDLVAPWR